MGCEHEVLMERAKAARLLEALESLPDWVAEWEPEHKKAAASIAWEFVPYVFTSPDKFIDEGVFMVGMDGGGTTLRNYFKSADE